MFIQENEGLIWLKLRKKKESTLYAVSVFTSAPVQQISKMNTVLSVWYDEGTVKEWCIY